MALCFEITVNDETPVVAGVEDISVLAACLTFVSSHENLELRIGGLISKGRHDNEHLEWVQRDLKPGDRVSIRVVEAANPSPPISRRREDPAASEQEERAYFERLKQRYERKS